MDDDLTLRAFREEDLEFLDRLDTDPAALGPFEWFGFRDVRTRRRRWEHDGFVGPESTALAVVATDGTLIGIGSWKAAHRGGSPGVCFEIGLALLPEYRGQGLGTAAQRLLVDHLFRFTTAHRLEAGTDADNVAEQKVLGRACSARWPSAMAPGEIACSTHWSETTSRDLEASQPFARWRNRRPVRPDADNSPRTSSAARAAVGNIAAHADGESSSFVRITTISMYSRHRRIWPSHA